MQLQTHEAAYFSSSLISVCFSFCILILAIWFRNADKRQKLLAFSLFQILVMNLASLLSNSKEISVILFRYADILLLLVFFTILLSGSKKLVMTLILLMPTAMIIAVHIFIPLQRFLGWQHISPAIIAILSVAVLYQLKSEKGDEAFLFWSILPLLASGIAEPYIYSGSAIYAVPLLKLISYPILLYYFYKVFLNALIAKNEDSKKKLSEFDRSIELEVKKRMIAVEEANRKLVDISKTDPLSNALNKAAILESIESLITERPGSEHSILMFDIDEFKEINDTYGHVTGDKCIKMLSATARSNFRDIDLFGRYGGDEFIVVLPGTGIMQAVSIAERFRKKVGESSSPGFTISLGVSSYPSDGRDVKTLIEVADKGLYLSKRTGRNAVSHIHN